MSQNSTINNPETKSSSSSSLKPELIQALGCLEVRLDQELTRYRRTHYENRSSKTVSLETPVVDQTQELENKTETAKTDSLLPEVNTEQAPIISPSIPKVEPIKLEENDHIKGASAQDAVTTLQPPMDTILSSSIVPTKPTEETDNLLATNPQPTHPDDYLESSEALIRSLQDQEPETKKENNYSQTLLSPVGIGSMLLLLLASLTLGYVVFNPQSFPQFDLSKLNFFNFNFAWNNNQLEPEENNSSSPSQANITKPIAKYPNLAAREFPEVNDPNDVVGLKPKPKPKPKPTPTVIPQPPAIANTNRPIPSTALPESVPLPELNTDIEPSADGYYYLITDNEGDDALAKVRQVVPKAYLSEGRKYIYLAALKDEEGAKRRLQELRGKGIKARVRQP